MAEQDQAHGHPGQKEPRSHGEIHHELRRMSLNPADQKEIEDLPMLGPKRAEALMAARPFKSWEDVARVEGMSLGMIDDLKAAAPTSRSVGSADHSDGRRGPADETYIVAAEPPPTP